MVTPNRLRSFSAEMLHALADNWDRLRDALDGDQARAQTKVVAPLTFDVWRGLGADRAMPVLNRITDQLGAARIETDAVATTLHDAARDLGLARQKFLIAEDEAEALGFTVQEPDGRVTWSTDYARAVCLQRGPG
ncbi:hypothetical protein LO772_11965 [Yinghuangia sp. ASG 101]|uniref:hypothetical protein n=1 Tax=Yinghuangia sp. ASG 101 TaxID=2896848 RepID=UPI001E3ABD7C|nr:hypothetical protein [Yinghuangia sp. ASG 101]UGQ14238.1 hypothetical protein LO772_11965 [Yinghuangia sp. ASG 101]